MEKNELELKSESKFLKHGKEWISKSNQSFWKLEKKQSFWKMEKNKLLNSTKVFERWKIMSSYTK